MSNLINEKRVDPNQQISVIAIIWFALFVSLGLYGYVGFMQLQGMESKSVIDDNMRLIFTILAILFFIISNFFRNKAYRIPDHLTISQFAGHLQTNLIIFWAINESIGIISLIACMSWGDEIAFYSLLGFALSWHIINMPRLTWIKEELLKYNQLKDLNFSD